MTFTVEIVPDGFAYGSRIFMPVPVALEVRRTLDARASWGGPDKRREDANGTVWLGWEYPDNAALFATLADLA